jgi:excisionase family DNA binding protein
LTAEEVAELLGVTVAWVYAQSRAGAIPTVKLGRYYRYRREAIERWIATQEVG